MTTQHDRRREALPALARRWSWVVVLAVGVALFELVRWVVVSTGNPNLVPALLVLGAGVVPTALTALLYNRYANPSFRPIRLVAVAVAGGAIGTVAAGVVEWGTLRTFGTLPVTAVAVTEETAKVLVLGIVLLFTRQPRTADGLVLGCAAGAGFAVFETLGYSAVALLQSHENLSAVDDLLFQRAVFSPATHMAWTGLLGAALWSAARRHWSARSVMTLVGTFLLAVALHAAWDSSTTMIGYVVLGTLGVAIFAITVHRVLPQAPSVRRANSSVTTGR